MSLCSKCLKSIYNESLINGSCKECYDQSKENIDLELEEKWRELEDVTTIENDEGDLILASDWYKFKAGTTDREIWGWFNKNHSKGIYYLTELE